MKLGKYPKYKDSGIQWIGKIPDEWKLKRIKSMAYVKGRIGWQGLTTDEYVDSGPFLVTGTDFNDGLVNWKTCQHVSEQRYSEDPYIQLKEEDLLITKDGTIGKTAVVKNMPDKTTLNSGIFLVRSTSKENNIEYLYWILNSNVFFDWIDYNKTGSTIVHLYQEKFVDFKLPNPSPEEQSTISAFLKRETSKLQQLIVSKLRQIELLQEHEKSLIHQAVTKGLDPKAKMKDSGIEWIGKIPEGWKVKRVKNLCIIEYGSALKEEIRIDGNIDVYGSNGIVGKHSEYISKSETIILGRKGSVGELNWSVRPCYPIDTTYYIDKALTSNNLRWLFYNLGCLRLTEFNQDSAVPGLSRKDVYYQKLPLPPKSEQKQIADYLDLQTSKIHEAINTIESQINKLEEYRKALIYEVVTGKVKVS